MQPNLTLTTQIWRFIVTGGLSAIVDFGLYVVLLWAGLRDHNGEIVGMGTWPPLVDQDTGAQRNRCSTPRGVLPAGSQCGDMFTASRSTRTHPETRRLGDTGRGR